MTADILVRLDDVHVTFGNLRALHGVSLTLERGRHTVLTGRNGAGKSTLMRVVRGEQRPAPGHGRVTWYPEGKPETSALAGRDMCAYVGTSDLDRRRRLRPGLPGLDLLLTGFADTDILYVDPLPEEREQALCLARENGAEDLLDRPVGELSRGALARLLLLRALLRRPRLLIIDEIFNSLDAAAHRQMLVCLERAAEHAGLLVAEHRPEDLPALPALEVHLEHGRIVSQNLRDFRPAGRENRPGGPAPCPDPGAPEIIRVENADVFVDGRRVLHGLDWTLRRGESWAVTGGNGAGKSVFLRLLGGDLYAAAGGRITRRHPAGHEEVRVRTEVRRLFRQVPEAPPAATRSLTGLGLVLTGFDEGMIIYRAPEENQIQEALRCLEVVEAARFADLPAHSLSTGQLRRVLLARALVGSPAVLLLDDPVAGLDATSRGLMGEIFNALAAAGTQLVLTARHAVDIPRAAAHVLLLDAGRIVSGEAGADKHFQC